jgi:hypothetical protein
MEASIRRPAPPSFLQVAVGKSSRTPLKRLKQDGVIKIKLMRGRNLTEKDKVRASGGPRHGIDPV